MKTNGAKERAVFGAVFRAVYQAVRDGPFPVNHVLADFLSDADRRAL